MKKNLLAILFLLLALICSACSSTRSETVPPAQGSMDETAEAILEDTQVFSPQPGYYVISSVGENGDITFFGASDPANGYLRLEDDHTGAMLFNEVEKELTWDEDSIIWNGEDLPFMGTSYFDPDLEQTAVMVVVYFLDSATSVIFRAAEEPAAP